MRRMEVESSEMRALYCSVEETLSSSMDFSKCMDSEGFRSPTIFSMSNMRMMRSSNRTTPVMDWLEKRATFMSGGSTFSQLMRWMRVTPETLKALVTLLNSETMTLELSLSMRVLPSQEARSMSGMILSRRLKAPRTEGWGISGMLVTGGMRMISRTLATLTP